MAQAFTFRAFGAETRSFHTAFTAPGSVIEWRWTHAIAGAWTSLEQQADGTSVVSLKIHSLSCPPVKMGQRSSQRSSEGVRFSPDCGAPSYAALNCSNQLSCLSLRSLGLWARGMSAIA